MLEFVSGQGYDYSKKVGKFEVNASEIRQFTELSKAREYYDSLHEYKAIWDITTGIAELLESHKLI